MNTSTRFVQQQFTRALIATSMVVALAACGGGSSSDSSSGGDASAQTLSFTSQPVSQIIAPGESVTFAAAGSGQALGYQWQRSTDGVNWSDVPGASAASYTIIKVDSSMSGHKYRVVMKGTNGNVVSLAASLTVSAHGAPALALLAGNLDGSGNADGTGAQAHFNAPYGVAANAEGDVYVADTSNHTIRKITPAGVVTTFAGTAGVAGHGNGIGKAATFNGPTALATDKNGNVYVADTDNHAIRKISPTGDVITFAGTPGVSGYANGPKDATFNFPGGVATDSSNNVYVADTNNHLIRKIRPDGVVSTFAGIAGVYGHADGNAATATFNAPTGIATDAAGNVFVADSNNHTIRKITATGMVSTLAGLPGVWGFSNGPGLVPSFHFPSALSTDSAGNLYVADTQNQTIRKITPEGIMSYFAGSLGTMGQANGAAATATFNEPHGLTVDGSGNIYVADTNNHMIRKISVSKEVSTLAGTANSVGHDDGASAEASFNNLGGIAVDGSGNAYVVDTGNHTVRKITSAGQVSTFSGTAGVPGSADAKGAAASYLTPRGIAMDSAGNAYVADTGNHTIRKISASGEVTTLAGKAGASGQADGSGPAARFNGPNGIVVDASGNVYVADTGNSTIRKISPSGAVTTLAGVAGIVGDSDGGAGVATFNAPFALCIDKNGYLYVADIGNGLIRKVSPGGQVSKLALAKPFRVPSAVVVDNAGNLYVADSAANTVSRVTPTDAVTPVVGVPGSAGFVGGVLPGVLNSPSALVIGDSNLYITTTNGVLMVQDLF